MTINSLHLRSLRLRCQSLAWLACLLTLLLLTTAPQAAAQKRGQRGSGGRQSAARPDARVARMLDEKGVKYVADEYGDYLVLVKLDSGRTQGVTVESEVVRGKGVNPFRVVRSNAMTSSGGTLPAAVVNRAKRENEEAGLENWEVVHYRDGTALEYHSFSDVDTDADSLLEMIIEVAETADAMESELTGQDEL